jgi:hypothetical protein
MYWTLLYKPGVTKLGQNTVARHALNSVYIVVELLLNFTPILKSHTPIMILVGLTYGLVNFIYKKADNYAIYDILKWESISSPILVLGVIVLAIVVVSIGGCIHYCKTKVKDNKSDYNNNNGDIRITNIEMN